MTTEPESIEQAAREYAQSRGGTSLDQHTAREDFIAGVAAGIQAERDRANRQHNLSHMLSED